MCIKRSRPLNIFKNFLLGFTALSLVGCVTPAEAAPARGIKKVCPDGTLVPFKKPCPDPVTPPDPDPLPGPVPSLYVSDVSVNENAGTATITINKSGTSSSGSQFSYATSNGTATAGSDYTATSGSSEVGAASTSRTITVPITNDLAVESSETFTFTITAGTNSQISDGEATVTIVDNDSYPAPSLSVADVSVTEGAPYAVVTVVKSGTTLDPALFTYTTSNGTATAGSDYTAISGSGSIAAGSSSQTFQIPITNDILDESSETINFTLTAGTNSVLSDGSAVVTIIDNDDPTPSLTVDDVMVNENSGTAVLTITRSNAANNPTTFNYATANMTATAAADYVAKSGTATIAAGALTTTISVSILEDTADESDEEFSFTITPVSNGTIASGTALVMIHDNDDPVVVPPPDTTPQPETGAPPIASNFDINTTLAAAGIPSVNSNDVVGAFRFICGAGQVSRNDPIVYPGQANKSHIHQFYGNTLADHNSTFSSLRTSGDSTCNNMGNGTAANRSAYWMPAMLDGKGNVVLPDYIQVYYKREPEPVDPAPYNGQIGFCDPAYNPSSPNNCIQIPNGLRYLTGFKMSTGTNNNVGWFKCTGTAVQKANTLGMTGFNLTTCPVGTRMEMTMGGPSCWNGQLDSVDHMSHMTGKIRNSTTGKVSCPSTHPYYMPVFTISAFFSIKNGDDPALWSLSSDSMFPSLPKGATLHFDYFEAWDAGVKAMWEAGCINKKLNCSAGNLGNGKTLRGASVPSYGWFNPVHLVPVSSIP